MLVIGTSFYSVPTLFLGFYIINFIQLGANCVSMCFDFEPKLMFVWRQKRQSADNKQGRVISDAGEDYTPAPSTAGAASGRGGCYNF